VLRTTSVKDLARLTIFARPTQHHEKKRRKEMKIIKFLALAELVCMYEIALSDNGIVKAISWVLFAGLTLAIYARLEKIYGSNQ
jgi:hypothetical protein